MPTAQSARSDDRIGRRGDEFPGREEPLSGKGMRYPQTNRWCHVGSECTRSGIAENIPCWRQVLTHHLILFDSLFPFDSVSD